MTLRILKYLLIKLNSTVRPSSILWCPSIDSHAKRYLSVFQKHDKHPSRISCNYHQGFNRICALPNLLHLDSCLHSTPPATLRFIPCICYHDYRFCRDSHLGSNCKWRSWRAHLVQHKTHSCSKRFHAEGI